MNVCDTTCYYGNWRMYGLNFTVYKPSSAIHYTLCVSSAVVATSATSSYKSLTEAVRPAQPTTAGGDSSTNDRVKPVATIQEGEGELAGDEVSNIPNEATDNTDSLKDQVSD